MTQTQQKYLGATCGKLRFVFLSNDNTVAGIEDTTTGKTEYMPLMRASRLGTWVLRDKALYISELQLNGHHGELGWAIVEPAVSTYGGHILPPLVEQRKAA